METPLLPQSDCHGLLPDGIHDATMPEIEARFGSFQNSDRRCQLFQKLSDYVAQIKQWLPGATIVLDGSFVMQCVDKPGDIDLVLVLPEGLDLGTEFVPVQYNLISRKAVKRSFPFDVFAVPSGSAALAE